MVEILREVGGQPDGRNEWQFCFGDRAGTVRLIGNGQIFLEVDACRRFGFLERVDQRRRQLNVDLLYVETDVDIKVRGHINLEARQGEMRFDLADAVPSTALDETLITIKVEALPAVCTSWEPVSRCRGIR